MTGGKRKVGRSHLARGAARRLINLTDEPQPNHINSQSFPVDGGRSEAGINGCEGVAAYEASVSEGGRRRRSQPEAVMMVDR